MVRLEKDKKDVWTKLPTSKKTHKMKKVIDRSILHTHVHHTHTHTGTHTHTQTDKHTHTHTHSLTYAYIIGAPAGALKGRSTNAPVTTRALTIMMMT